MAQAASVAVSSAALCQVVGASSTRRRGRPGSANSRTTSSPRRAVDRQWTARRGSPRVCSRTPMISGPEPRRSTRPSSSVEPAPVTAPERIVGTGGRTSTTSPARRPTNGTSPDASARNRPNRSVTVTTTWSAVSSPRGSTASPVTAAPLRGSPVAPTAPVSSSRTTSEDAVGALTSTVTVTGVPATARAGTVRRTSTRPAARHAVAAAHGTTPMTIPASAMTHPAATLAPAPYRRRPSSSWIPTRFVGRTFPRRRRVGSMPRSPSAVGVSPFRSGRVRATLRVTCSPRPAPSAAARRPARRGRSARRGLRRAGPDGGRERRGPAP